MVGAELLLSIRLDQQRTLSLSSTFSFLILLYFGPLYAIVAQVGAWTLNQTTDFIAMPHTRHNRRRLLSTAVQQLIAGGVGCFGIWLVLGSTPAQPPVNAQAGLVLYAFSYLTVARLIVAIQRSYEPEMENASGYATSEANVWEAVVFLFGVPLALLVTNFGSRLGFTFDMLVAFVVLATLSYIIRLKLQLQATTLESKVLNEISHSLSGSTELNKLYPAIFARVRQVIPVDVFYIGLLNEAHTEIDVPYLVEDGEKQAPRSFPIENTLADRIVRDGKPLYLSKAEYQMPHVRSGQTGKPSEAVMFVPLCLGEDAIGIISAQSYTPDAYTEQQLSLLDSIGRIAAVAINNARLFAREKEVLRGREEFISLVAHELKNPLAALLGHAQILERRARNADEKLRRPITIIQAQGERMNRLVEDLLDLSRVDTGRLALHLQRIELGALAREVVEQQQVLTTQHQLSVTVDETLPVIEGDVMRLTQVLQNLLNNAIKYSPKGGTITVDLAVQGSEDQHWPMRIHKLVVHRRCWIVVQVRDQGIGVPPDQIDHIFERFYRANNTAQLEVGGTGLGLSVCDALVKAHGGVIWAESEWGIGSTFTFALPISEAGTSSDSSS
jgi:signal transduction histidine kinase